MLLFRLSNLLIYMQINGGLMWPWCIGDPGGSCDVMCYIVGCTSYTDTHTLLWTLWFLFQSPVFLCFHAFHFFPTHSLALCATQTGLMRTCMQPIVCVCADRRWLYHHSKSRQEADSLQVWVTAEYSKYCFAHFFSHFFSNGSDALGQSCGQAEEKQIQSRKDSVFLKNDINIVEKW